MDKLDMMKILSRFDDDVDEGDFSPEEWQEMMEEYARQTGKKVTKEDFKEAYFSYYDDVKDKSLKKQDW